MTEISTTRSDAGKEGGYSDFKKIISPDPPLPPTDPNGSYHGLAPYKDFCIGPRTHQAETVLDLSIVVVMPELMYTPHTKVGRSWIVVADQ